MANKDVTRALRLMQDPDITSIKLFWERFGRHDLINAQEEDLQDQPVLLEILHLADRYFPNTAMKKAVVAMARARDKALAVMAGVAARLAARPPRKHKVYRAERRNLQRHRWWFTLRAARRALGLSRRQYDKFRYLHRVKGLPESEAFKAVRGGSEASAWA